MRALVASLLLVAAAVRAEPLERFFVMGDGRLAVENAHTGERADVHYRRADGTYDDDAIAQIRRAFRSKGDESDGKLSLRLIEVLSRLQRDSGLPQLRLVSGYRSLDYNEALRQRGAKAAGGSLHSEGLAADVAFPRPKLRPLWMKLRALDCCGAGYYAKEGFLHVDVGRPRFWEPQTSRVDENLSAGNARLFARTEFDRYTAGEPITVTLHAMTVPPVRLSPQAMLESVPAKLDGGASAFEGCLVLDGERTTMRATVDARSAHGRLALSTCEPRLERTPARVETNVFEVR